jgi:hypothetical protein
VQFNDYVEVFDTQAEYDRRFVAEVDFITYIFLLKTNIKIFYLPILRADKPWTRLAPQDKV